MRFEEGTKFQAIKGPNKWDLTMAAVDKRNHPTVEFTWIPLGVMAEEYDKDKRAMVLAAGEEVGNPGTFWVRLATWYEDVEYTLEGTYSVEDRNGEFAVVDRRRMVTAYQQRDEVAKYPEDLKRIIKRYKKRLD